MNADEVTRSISGWLAPTTMNLTPEILAVRQEAIVDLAGSSSAFGLVAVAYGRGDSSAVRAVEEQLRAFDTTYVDGKLELVSRVAGSAAMLALASESDRATQIALLVQSADFLGWTSPIAELSARAIEVEFGSSLRARRRPLPKKVNGTRLRADPEPTMEELVTAVNANTRRVDDLHDIVSQRVASLDEEVDLLWWGQSAQNRQGETWEDLPPIERAISAAVMLSEILTAIPAPAVALDLLSKLAGPTSDEVRMIDFAEAAGTRLGDRRASSKLMPLLTSATVARDFPGEHEVLPALIRKEGVDPEFAFPTDAIAAQLIRELSLLEL